MIKIIGIGSPFGDDQAGLIVAEGLKKELEKQPDKKTKILIEACDRPGVGLIELMRGFSTVYIIDAVKSGSEQGTIHHLTKEHLINGSPGFSTHGIGVSEALQIAAALDELPDDLHLYGIEIDTIALDSTLSKPIENAITQLIFQLTGEWN